MQNADECIYIRAQADLFDDGDGDGHEKSGRNARQNTGRLRDDIPKEGARFGDGRANP